MKEISTSELRRRLASPSQPFLLDVRQPEEFAATHIDGAVLIPLGELSGRLGELKKDVETVVICRSGARSAHACQLLGQAGFGDVANLVGGMLRWDAEG